MVVSILFVQIWLSVKRVVKSKMRQPRCEVALLVDDSRITFNEGGVRVHAIPNRKRFRSLSRRMEAGRNR
jgi:hypothetical protein